jgi:hypothetical protein
MTSLINEDETSFAMNSSGKLLVSISNTNPVNVTLGEGVTMTEATRAFFNELKKIGYFKEVTTKPEVIEEDI